MLNLYTLPKKGAATVDYQAGARGSVRNVCGRDLQPWHWRLSAFGSRYLQIQPFDLRNCGTVTTFWLQSLLLCHVWLRFSGDLTYHWPIAGNCSRHCRHLEDNMNSDVVSSPWAACAHEDWISWHMAQKWVQYHNCDVNCRCIFKNMFMCTNILYIHIYV